MKIDPYKHKQKYENWKKKGVIERVLKFNSDITVEYLEDMKNGFNVARRGAVSYIRLNNIRQRMSFILRELERLYKGKKVIDITDREIATFFNMMRDGRILTKKGKQFI